MYFGERKDVVNCMTASCVDVKGRYGTSIGEGIHLMSGEQGDIKLGKNCCDVLFDGSVIVPVEITANVDVSFERVLSEKYLDLLQYGALPVRLEIYVKNMLHFASASYRGQRGEVGDNDGVLQICGGYERREQCEGASGVVLPILFIHGDYGRCEMRLHVPEEVQEV